MNFVLGLSQFLSARRTLRTMIFTVHADRLGLFVVTAGQDQCSELSTFDASGI